MKLYVLLSVTVLFLLIPATVPAQRQGNVWCCGNGTGIDFNDTPPRIFTCKMYGNEGSASIADASTGRLLFYSDGLAVWNSNFDTMANGGGLAGVLSSNQPALIVPDPGDSMRYYLFTSDAQPSGMPGTNLGIHYSIIDMRYEGGLGRVVQKNVPLFQPACEKLAATFDCNGRDFWVLAHEWDNDRYHAYHITAAGISLPVISATGIPHTGGWINATPYANNARGPLKISPNGKKIAAAILDTAWVELADFDNRTGLISNSIVLSVGSQIYGVGFSPDNSKLYVSAAATIPFDPDTLYQYEILEDRSAIAATRALIALMPRENGYFSGMQLAPDGTLYIAGEYYYLAAITRPNLKGQACNYLERAILLNGHSVGWELPDMIDTWYDQTHSHCRPPKSRFVISDTTICQGSCVDFHDRSIDSPLLWNWSFPGAFPDSSSSPNPSGICYSDSGTFSVRLIVANPNGYDTTFASIHVLPLPTPDAGPDTTICLGTAITLGAPDGSWHSMTLRWEPTTDLDCSNCPNPLAHPSGSTTYRLLATDSNGCHALDSTTITVVPPPTIQMLHDTAICAGQSLLLSAAIDPPLPNSSVSVRWTPADGLDCDSCLQPIAIPARSTTYHLTVSVAETCTITDSVTVLVTPQPSIDAGDDLRICSGESVELSTSAAGTLRWSPSEGLSCDDCSTPVATPTRTTTYTVTVISASGCSAQDSVTVIVGPLPKLSPAVDTMICLGTSIRFPWLIDSSTAPENDLRILWSPADGLDCDTCARPTASPLRTTTYGLTATDQLGCSDSTHITIYVDDQPAVLHAHIESTLSAYPGTNLLIPIFLDDDVQNVHISDIEVLVLFQSESLVLRSTTAEQIQHLLHGTLLDGWLVTILDIAPGVFHARFHSPDGQGLSGPGQLLRLECSMYLANTMESDLFPSISVPESQCLRFECIPGHIRLDSICGLSLRLIESNGADYALEQNYPNPFNPQTEVGFSVALDGLTRLRVFDAQGREVARLIDAYLQPGRYVVQFNAEALPSGSYCYRLESGAYTGTRRMMLIK